MCELFGVTAKNRIKVTGLLDTFFSHSADHRNGWGLVYLDVPPAIIHKEPQRATNSRTLRELLEKDTETAACIAHIRKATIGEEHSRNTHPFEGTDESGRRWTLAHNGTVFDADILAPYQYKQKGETDSERILLYIIDEVNKNTSEGNSEASDISRFKVVEEAVKKLAHGNKLNLLIHDGEYLYVHKNEAGTLFKKEGKDTTYFATVPLEEEGWTEFPGNRLSVYKDGRSVYIGEEHENTYVHNEENMKLLYLAFSGL